LKRTNDVYEEEIANIIEGEGVSRQEAENDAFFQIPPDARWESLNKVTLYIATTM